MKNDRLFSLLYLLLERGQMTAPTLAEALEVSVRTVYRDVETLSMAGVPIYATAGKSGGISLAEGYSFDKTLLSDSEQEQLLFAVQSLKAADQQVDGLLSKLGSAFGQTRPDWIEVDFSRWGLRRVDSLRFETIKNAILNKLVLHLVYCGTSGDTTERDIHPLRLIYKDKHWYLQGYCLKAEDYRLFKISRILELTSTGERFSDDYDSDIPPIEVCPPPGISTRFRLRISGRLAFRVYDEFDRESITTQPDGALLVEGAFPLDSWVLGYLFSFGTELEVLEPPELRRRLADYAEKIAAHHKT